ncbi:MAG: hypothetical protein AB9M53_00425 [Leptothrix sp. (in: b-proteobacteria)]
MATLREQILARALVALTGTTPAGANVFRSREASITRAMTPAIVLMPQGEQDDRYGQSTDHHQFTIEVAIFSRGDPWDQIADGVAEAVHRVLIADAGLQALATDVRKVSTSYESEEADRTAGTLGSVYRITYLSKSSDIAAAP